MKICSLKTLFRISEVFRRVLRCGIVVITTAQPHSTGPELRLCAGSNHACCVSEIRDGEDLWQWYWLEIRLNAFRRSTIIRKQFINSKNSSVQLSYFLILFLTLFQILLFFSNNPSSWIKKTHPFSFTIITFYVCTHFWRYGV